MRTRTQHWLPVWTYECRQSKIQETRRRLERDSPCGDGREHAPFKGGDFLLGRSGRVGGGGFFKTFPVEFVAPRAGNWNMLLYLPPGHHATIRHSIRIVKARSLPPQKKRRGDHEGRPGEQEV